MSGKSSSRSSRVDKDIVRANDSGLDHQESDEGRNIILLEFVDARKAD